MAVQCAHCGRSDLMQALIRGYQCLACGNVTDDNQNKVVPQSQGPNLSNSGVPIPELGDLAPVVLAPQGEAVSDSPGETTPETPETPVEPSEQESAPTEPDEEVIDLSNLTDEQRAQIQAVVTNG